MAQLFFKKLLRVQFDALVAALPLSDGGEEAQLKRIAELQVCTQLAVTLLRFFKFPFVFIWVYVFFLHILFLHDFRIYVG